MANWLNFNAFELTHREHYEKLKSEMERERLVRQALAGHDTNRLFFCRMLSWLGHCLVAWGQRLAADQPIQAGRGVDRPSEPAQMHQA